MTALITGASTGLGREMAIYLSELGYDLIITARDREKLMSLKRLLPTRVKVITGDLSKPDNAVKLYKLCRNIKVDILINNAGIGVVGGLDKTSLEKERELIDLNITALHILTKLFMKDFIKRDSGRILNVSSSAGFFPGPLMAAYYASKSYVLNLSQAVYRELKEIGSNVTISVLCPGPVQTEFNKRAGVTNSAPPADCRYTARYAVDMMFKNKFCIIPDVKMKFVISAASFLPANIKSKIIYMIQNNRKPLDDN